jgi:hypothetical protein
LVSRICSPPPAHLAELARHHLGAFFDVPESTLKRRL